VNRRGVLYKSPMPAWSRNRSARRSNPNPVRAGRAASTITRRCAAIRYAHRLADLEPPTNSESVRATLRGIRRAVGAAPDRKVPVLAETARAMALSAPEGLKGLRDRALLLLGFAGAFRRSELVALEVADLEETDDGFKIVIRRSKTDQEGHGTTIAIVRGHHACPVKAVKAWLAASGISEGPLFRPVSKGGRLSTRRLSAKSVCEIVKAYAGRVGLKPADFGAHSLRAGFLTSAARRGASVFKMRDVSRHKSMDVLQASVRDADLHVEAAQRALPIGAVAGLDQESGEPGDGATPRGALGVAPATDSRPIVYCKSCQHPLSGADSYEWHGGRWCGGSRMTLLWARLKSWWERRSARAAYLRLLEKDMRSRRRAF
jgi:integrase